MKKLKPIILPLSIPIIFFILWNNYQIFELADFAWRDMLYTLRASIFQTSTIQSSNQSLQNGGVKSDNIINDVIIVAVDEPSFQQLKLRWPWSRTLHAELVEKLSSAGAAAIVFDILFPEKSSDESEDLIFAQAVKKAGNVVLAANLTITGRRGYETYFIEEPIPVLASAAASIGMVNFYPDGDGSVRAASNFVDNRPSIAFAAVNSAFKRNSSLTIFDNFHYNTAGNNPLYLDVDSSKAEADNTNNKTNDIEYLEYINEGGHFFIDYAGKAGTIPALSYYQVINDMVDPAVFKDKIVFIGFIADSAVEVQSGADAYPYPFMRFTKKMIFGVEIQSNVVRTILRDYPISLFSMPLLKWVWFYIFASIMIPFSRRPVYLILSTMLILIAASLTSILIFRFKGIIIDVLPLITGASINTVFIGLNEFSKNYKEKSVLRKAFSSYVSPDVVASIIADHESLKLGGERKRLSVLFSDIRGFTTLSEKLSPEELVSLLNDYFTRMTDVIFQHNGTLDKYIGDAIMVIFGAPVWSDNHAENSCYTALEMKTRLKEMNEEISAASTSGNSRYLSLAIGIGINTGEMIVGNMGSLKRFDYTVMGDEVNLASRLEGVTKAYSVEIIISEETKSDLNPDKFLCRELDLIRVKGKYNAIKIYELVSTYPVSESDEECVKLFTKGLELYRNAYKENLWDEAASLFKKALEYKQDDGPSKLFIERCGIFKNNPPVEQGEEWDGVWVMTTK